MTLMRWKVHLCAPFTLWQDQQQRIYSELYQIFTVPRAQMQKLFSHGKTCHTLLFFPARAPYLCAANRVPGWQSERCWPSAPRQAVLCDGTRSDGHTAPCGWAQLKLENNATCFSGVPCGEGGNKTSTTRKTTPQ